MQQTALPLYRRVVELFCGKLAHASAWLFVGGIIGGILGYGVVSAFGGAILAFLAICFSAYGALHRPLAAGRGLPFQTAHLSFKPALPVCNLDGLRFTRNGC